MNTIANRNFERLADTFFLTFTEVASFLARGRTPCFFSVATHSLYNTTRAVSHQ
jgi:hypothetical protein